MMTRQLCLLLALGVATAACGGDQGSASEDAGGDTDLIPEIGRDVGSDADADTAPPPNCDLSVAPVGPTSIILDREERVELSVQVTDCDDQPWPEATVEFELVGTVGGALLRNNRATTDGAGTASTTLVAGNADATFDVEARLGEALVVFDVRVSSGANGDLHVVIENTSDEALVEYSAFLFGRGTCDDVDPFDPFGATDIVEPITDIDDPVRFVALPPSDTYAVAVQGRDEDDAVLGFGCVEGVRVVDRDVTTVTVEVGILPVVFTGIYELNNELDLADVMPPSVETTLRVLDELSDDDAISGDSAAGSWGVDPAAFILDFVYRQFCCWQAADTDPDTPGIQADWSSCSAQEFTHPIGDLELLYTRDFLTWDGAQPSSAGLCGGLEFANEPVMGLVQGVIETNVPNIALNLVTMIGDLSRAVTEMHVISELTVGDVAIGKNGTFTHELKLMVVELHGLDGSLGVYTFDLEDAGFDNLSYSAETTASAGNVLNIPEHSFRLDFGRLLRFVFTDVLLPTLDCDSDHDGDFTPCEDTADLLGTWINCVSVGEWMYDQIGFPSPGSYETACNLGVDAAGLAVESALEASIDAQTVITLEGTTNAGSIDERREATTLVNGVWIGHLVEDDVAYGEFPGEFSGERIADLD